MLISQSRFGSEQLRIEVVGNAIPQGDGYDLPVDTGTQEGTLWIHEDHYAMLDLDEDNVITNGKLSRSGNAIVCTDVKAPESNYGLKTKKKKKKN